MRQESHGKTKGLAMATKARASGKEQRSEGGPKARPRGRGLRYRVRTRGSAPDDLRERVSSAHASAIHGLLEAEREAQSPSHGTARA